MFDKHLFTKSEGGGGQNWKNIRLVKRDLWAYNGKSFFMFNNINSAHNMHTVNFYNQTMQRKMTRVIQ